MLFAFGFQAVLCIYPHKFIAFIGASNDSYWHVRPIACANNVKQQVNTLQMQYLDAVHGNSLFQVYKGLTIFADIATLYFRGGALCTKCSNICLGLRFLLS